MMDTPEWETGSAAERYLDDAERSALALAGYRSSGTPPQRPALLVVDVTYGFCGPPDLALGEAVQHYPLASGESAWRAVPRVAQLVLAARELSLPIVFTRPHLPSPHRLSVRWGDTNTRHLDRPADAHDIVREVGALESDLMLDKDAPSAFFGTPLRTWLTSLDRDGVIICGGTTSGCVRATAVDAFSHGLRTTVVPDACFDRVTISHEVALFDLGLKYASLIPVQQLLAALRGSHDLRTADAVGETDHGPSSRAGNGGLGRTMSSPRSG